MKNILLLASLSGILLAANPGLAQDAATPADSTPQPPATPDNPAAPTAPAPAVTPVAPAAPATPLVAPAAPATATPAVDAPVPVPPVTRAHPVAMTDTNGSVASPAQRTILMTNADGTWSLNMSSATTPALDTNAPMVTGTGEKGLRMNFRGAPLETVLNYMSDAAGFIIHPRVPVTGKVDVWSARPLSPDEAVKLLQQVLSENGYTAMRDGRTLTIIKSEDAARSTIPVRSNSDPANIPNNAEVVTQIIPVHTLNVVQLAKDLEPLRPSGAVLTADESANSLVMTDTQSNIKHIAEIVKALDSVTSSSAVVRVFPLKYADSKSLASLMKDLFPSADTSSRSGSSSTPSPFPGFFGGRSDRGERSSSRGGGEESGNGHTPTAKVNAVSDDHSNSLIVSAPEEVMPTIEQLIKQVDTPVEEETQVKLFHLKNADATEMSDLLTSLFPDDTSSSDATRSRFGFFFPGGQQPAASSANTSDRMKKMTHVGVAADRRTSTLVVTAGKDLMPQISTMIEELDQRPDRKMTMHVVHLQNADPIDIQSILQDMLASSGSSSSSRSGSSGASGSTTGQNYLQNRAQTLLQQQNSTQSSSSGALGGGTSTGRGF